MYRGRLKRDLAQWVAMGLLNEETAAALVHELDSRRNAFGFAHVLLMLAAVFLSVAVLLLIAANWQLIPRLVRLGGVVALIWGFHLAAAWAFGRDLRSLGAGALLLGTAAFGGGLALTGQMYHLSGDLTTMLAVWFAGAALTTGLFRSGAVTVAAGFLAHALCWSLLDASDAQFTWANMLAPPLLALAVFALAAWSRETRAVHLGLLLLIGWTVWLYTLNDGPFAAALLAATGLALLLAVSLSVSPLRAFAQRAGGAPAFYALLVAAIGLFLLHVELEKGPQLLLAGIAGLLTAVIALAVEGRDNGGVRALAYLIIAGVILHLSFETVGSILGTSGFFLLAALAAALLAFIVIRLEKRFAAGRKAAS